MDIEQALPLQVEIKSRDPAGQQPVVRMEHMRWNQDIPDSLFSVDIPPGYARTELPKPSEEYLVKAFKTCAELSSGSFPPQFDSPKLMNFFWAYHPEVKHFMPEHDGIPGVTANLDDATLEQLRTCFVGSQFIDEIHESAQWRYFGSSVKYGDSGTVLLCWRPGNAANWRVIYGDLSAKELPLDQLPAMPATSP
jgi:hypothetical protein